MTPKRKVSQREIWLLALLPAALVAIVSFSLPGPADELPELEDRLERLSTDGAQTQSKLRAFSQEMSKTRQEQKALEARETELKAAIASISKPTARSATLNMAGVLDELAHRLNAHGVQVLAMETGGPRAPKPIDAATGTPPRQWVVSVAATWPALRSALADDQVFPPGLGLAAMKMDPAQNNRSLRRWELIATVSESMP
ncbi:MAG: hypothetical protein AAF750_09670 [Planctomycetota bacterium]